MTSLSPTTVLITGSSRGLGLEFVKQFLQLPNPPKILFAGCRKPEQATDLQELASEHKNLRVLQLDVADDGSIEAARVLVESQVGDAGLNLLLNNAGVNSKEDGLEHLTREGMNFHFDSNVTSPLLVAKSFRPLLKKAAGNHPGGKMSCNKAAVINVSSVMGLVGVMYQNKRMNYQYQSSKCALNMASAILANEMSPDGVLVTAFHPGWVRTDMGGSGGRLAISESVSHSMKTFATFDESVCGVMVRYDGYVFSWADTTG